MANITRIKAGETHSSSDKKPAKKSKKDKNKFKNPKTAELLKNSSEDKVDKKVLVAARQVEKAQKKAEKAALQEKTGKGKKPFILFRPFIALGRYLKESWRELRQVRWPNRKLTWKLVLAVFVYTLLFTAFLVALDLLFDWLFSLILK